MRDFNGKSFDDVTIPRIHVVGEKHVNNWHGDEDPETKFMNFETFLRRDETQAKKSKVLDDVDDRCYAD